MNLIDDSSFIFAFSTQEVRTIGMTMKDNLIKEVKDIKKDTPYNREAFLQSRSIKIHIIKTCLYTIGYSDIFDRMLKEIDEIFKERM